MPGYSCSWLYLEIIPKNNAFMKQSRDNYYAIGSGASCFADNTTHPLSLSLSLSLSLKKFQYSVKIYKFIKQSSRTYALVGIAWSSCSNKFYQAVG
jgi:hypothetical protein